MRNPTPAPETGSSAASATLVYAPRAPHKGRGTMWALEHRFSADQREAFDDGWGTLEQAAHEEVLAPQTQIIEERVKSILAGNDSPDIGFDLSINPYRGCEHVMRQRKVFRGAGCQQGAGRVSVLAELLSSSSRGGPEGDLDPVDNSAAGIQR